MLTVEQMKAKAEAVGAARVPHGTCTTNSGGFDGIDSWAAAVVSPDTRVCVGVYGFATERDALGALIRALVKRDEKPAPPDREHVAPPKQPNGCWALMHGLTRSFGCRAPRSRAGGFLTCFAHRKHEEAAQALKARLEAGKGAA
jgi:hypothetical protein